jgi:hypothetical protein
MQKRFRSRRFLAWLSCGHWIVAIFAFRTSPQVGQQRTRITMRPWLSLGQRAWRVIDVPSRFVRGPDPRPIRAGRRREADLDLRLSLSCV